MIITIPDDRQGIDLKSPAIVNKRKAFKGYDGKAAAPPSGPIRPGRKGWSGFGNKPELLAEKRGCIKQALSEVDEGELLQQHLKIHPQHT